jgi:hypothetical protein
VRGRVEARLRAGRGRLGGGELRLDLAWELTGSLRTRLAVPGAGGLGTWTPEVPVHGTAEGTASGREALPAPTTAPRRGAP